MTVEEAVEVILCGAYINCPGCDGKGVVKTDEIRKPHDIASVSFYTPCRTCDSWGRVIRAEYLHACKILGRPCPHDYHYIHVYPEQFGDNPFGES